LFWQSPARGSLDAVVGENESAEYFRQSKTVVKRWGAAGLATRFGVVPGANHFTAIAPMADPDSPWWRGCSNWRRADVTPPECKNCWNSPHGSCAKLF